MKKRIKIKGRLRSYLQSSIAMGIMLALVNLIIYLMDYRSGLLLTGALLVYFVVVLRKCVCNFLSFLLHKPPAIFIYRYVSDTILLITS